MKRFLCFLLLFLHLQAVADDNQHFLALWRNQGRSIYSRQSYTTLEAFSFPIKIQNTHPFFDLRYHHFDKGENAASVGFGVRLDSPCSKNIFGVNAFYDYRRVCRSNFNQFGLGLELLGQCWNFRINGYLPLGKKSHRCTFCFFDDYIGDFFFIHETFRDSLKGVNFEIEGFLRNCRGYELALAVGPYYYHRSKGCQKDLYGSQLRLTAGFCNYLTIGVLASYDNIFKGRIQAQIGLILPLYFKESYHIGNSNPQLYQRIQRNDAIILKSRNKWIFNF